MFCYPMESAPLFYLFYLGIVPLNLQIFESSKDFVHHARRSLGNCSSKNCSCLAQLGPRIASMSLR